MSSFKVLLDQCGIWLSTEQLDADMWFAILKGYLKVRITACVMADERISFTVSDGPVNSTIEVVDKIIAMPRRFKYRKVSPYSIFANNRGENLGVADQADNTASLVEFAQGLSASGGSEAEYLRIHTAVLLPAFSPGDKVIASADSRDILGVKYDSRSICWLEKIDIDFASQQTILTAAKKRK
jgi:DNA-binding beta-propeller fold protein YncE